LMGPGAGRLYGSLSGAGCSPPSAGRDADGRRVGGVRRRRPARAATAIAPARVDRCVADSPGAALVSGAVRVVRFALSRGTLSVMGATGAAAGNAGRGHERDARSRLPLLAVPGSPPRIRSLAGPARPGVLHSLAERTDPGTA